jgi:CheY-like chemotaxis protein
VTCRLLAADGLEAIQKAELKPGLILMDIGLPSLNGIEAARQIRKLVPETKIIFLSQESSADVVQQALERGRVRIRCESKCRNRPTSAHSRCNFAVSVNLPPSCAFLSEHYRQATPIQFLKR